jgi:hypothetical protein
VLFSVDAGENATLIWQKCTDQFYLISIHRFIKLLHYCPVIKEKNRNN